MFVLLAFFTDAMASFSRSDSAQTAVTKRLALLSKAQLLSLRDAAREFADIVEHAAGMR